MGALPALEVSYLGAFLGMLSICISLVPVADRKACERLQYRCSFCDGQLHFDFLNQPDAPEHDSTACRPKGFIGKVATFFLTRSCVFEGS